MTTQPISAVLLLRFYCTDILLRILQKHKLYLPTEYKINNSATMEFFLLELAGQTLQSVFCLEQKIGTWTMPGPMRSSAA